MARYTLDWSFGLRNSEGKYLTAEVFGFGINCASNVMKKKQIFFLEQGDGDDKSVYIRSHLNKYLKVNGDGKFTANGDGDGDRSELAFTIEAQSNGQWLLKSTKYGWYAGGSGENLNAFTTMAAEDRKWVVHLAMHPQICLRNMNRKRYVHLTEGPGGQASVNCDEQIPWGHDATLMLEFDGKGQYRLQASNGLYVSQSGKLTTAQDDTTSYVLEFDQGQVSFKGVANGKYMTCLGSTGLCKATKAAIGADERFVMEDSWAQATLTANNGKLVSIKQGVGLAAMTAADEGSDLEVFQLEPNSSGQWIVKTIKETLWTLIDGRVEHVTKSTDLDANSAKAECLFTIDWNGPMIALKASNGKYVSRKMNGYLFAEEDDGKTESCQFTFNIINRPKLVLRGEHGFVGTLPSGLLECNKSVPEVFEMTMADGMVAIKSTATDRYWMVGQNGVSAKGTSAEFYTLALQAESKLTIAASDERLFAGQQNGAFTVTGDKIDKSTLWEY